MKQQRIMQRVFGGEIIPSCPLGLDCFSLLNNTRLWVLSMHSSIESSDLAINNGIFTNIHRNTHTLLSDAPLANNHQENNQSSQFGAISLWERRCKILYLFHSITLISIFITNYYYTSILALVIFLATLLYCYITRQAKKNFIVIYALLLLANLTKNIALLSFYFKSTDTINGYIYMLVLLLLIDIILLSPASAYCSLFLYRSISLQHFTF
jgi:hypothetical protein